MIIEGILWTVVALFAFFLGLRLYDKYQLKKLRTKFPEGYDDGSRPVEKMKDRARL